MKSKERELAMNRIIRALLTLTGMAWATASLAQAPMVTYHYDECGNRIERTMGFKKVEKNGDLLATNEEKSWQAKVEDDLDGCSMSLYPNPTDGKFSIVLSEEMQPSIQAELCTMGGTIIESRSVRNVVEEFDLTRHPAGIYILRLTSGEETQTWKIIKRN